MTGKVLVKAYIPETLAKALARECKACGCTQSAVISMAILERVRQMAQQRRSEIMQLPGQLELLPGGVNAGNDTKAQIT